MKTNHTPLQALIAEQIAKEFSNHEYKFRTGGSKNAIPITQIQFDIIQSSSMNVESLGFRNGVEIFKVSSKEYEDISYEIYVMTRMTAGIVGFTTIIKTDIEL